MPEHSSPLVREDVDQDNAELDRLVESNLYLVQHVLNELASRFPRHVDRRELWSAGAAGLVEASRRYDPSSGVPFGSFARLRIRGAMIDATRADDWAPRRLRRELRALSEATARFEMAHGRSPSTAELAEALQLPVEKLVRQQASASESTLLHLDLAIDHGDGGTTTLGDAVRDTTCAGPQDTLEQRELLGTLATAIRFLPELQREVVERTFFAGELLRDVADSLGVTEARVSQIRTEALTAMKAYFATSFEEVEPVAPGAPGMRQRAAYVAELASHSTWRTRLDATAAPRSRSPSGS